MPTASDFSNWVFDYYKGPRRRAGREAEAEEQEALRLGAIDHHDIERIRTDLVGKSHDWFAEYVDHADSSASILIASALKVYGQPLRCKPDLVLCHKSKRQRIIVERKTTRQVRLIEQREPTNWKNIQAQLWCYSYIDQWADCPNITLIGELWYRSHGSLMRSITKLEWNKGDPLHENECRSLFNQWRVWGCGTR